MVIRSLMQSVYLVNFSQKGASSVEV